MTKLLVYDKSQIDFQKLNLQDFELFWISEQKWFKFSLSLQKKIIKENNKYDQIIFFWVWFSKIKTLQRNFYKIDRCFLFNKNIIDNQKYFKFNDNICLEQKNIVSLFDYNNIQNKIYDFWEIFDKFWFWISNLSTSSNLNILHIVYVFPQKYSRSKVLSQEKQIEFLLNPDHKRNIWLTINKIFINKFNNIVEKFIKLVNN